MKIFKFISLPLCKKNIDNQKITIFTPKITPNFKN